MNIHDVIRRPLVTEKSTIAREDNNLATFAVNPDANKHDIRRAVEELFNVEVTDVRTGFLLLGLGLRLSAACGTSLPLRFANAPTLCDRGTGESGHRCGIGRGQERAAMSLAELPGFEAIEHVVGELQ